MIIGFFFDRFYEREKAQPLASVTVCECAPIFFFPIPPCSVHGRHQQYVPAIQFFQPN